MSIANKRPFLSFVTSAIVWISQHHHQASGHGYLSTPRSRNLLAKEDTVWWPQTEKDPEPETCPHCLNHGGSRARCGISEDSQGMRNYDAPKNALGGLMPTKIQADYTQGEDVVMDVTLTAHHKGHFVFSACSISPGEIPTQECFDQNHLTFVEDLLHGANFDPNYPERAMLAPVDDPNYVPDLGKSTGVMEYSFKMRLPPDLYGDLVLIQWYYLTANSCYHEGYLQYDWPASWNSADTTTSGLCVNVSSDGTGSPEQFWNCAEVKILPRTNTVPTPNGPVKISPAIAIPASLPPAEEKSNPFDISLGISIPVSLPSQNSMNVSPSAGSHGKTIVGYYASWQWYDRNKKAAPENMDFTKVQRVNFAFFQIDTAGNMWGTDSWADPQLLFGPYNWNPPAGAKQYCSWDSVVDKPCNHHNYEQGLIHLAHAAGAEVYPSLGGWTLSDAFPAMAASATARAIFTQNCINLIKEYDFDGIDLDWEYPGYEDHSGTPQDRNNFKLLLNEVRAKLDELGAQTGKFYGLTAALPCGPRHIANMDIAHVASTLSELNLMTYDFHGAFSVTTGTNAPLYDQGWGEEDFDVDSCVNNWLKGGGSREKINIGLPFYGRSFAGATGMNQPHTGADQTVFGIDDGTPQYFNIVAQLPSMKQVWDKKTWTQYAYFDNGGLVSFDNENAICAKVEYAIEHNLGGFIIWELSGDVMDDLSTPLLDITNNKLNNPDLNCGEPGFYPEEGRVPATSISGFPALPGTDPTPSIPVSYTMPPIEPSDYESPNDQTMFICGNQQGTFSIADSKALDLSYRYEVHSNSAVPISDSLTELKSSVLSAITEKLNCAGTSSALRRLRSKSFEISQDSVRAIESTQPEFPENDIPCSIPVNLNVPSTCYSVIGSMTAHVEKDTPPSVLNAVVDELLFFIRTSMAAGRYESGKVRKVIYLENLSAIPLNTNANANIVWRPQSEVGNNSPVATIVLSLLVIVMFGILLVAYVARRKRESDIREADGHSTISESKPDVQISSTEEGWNNAINTNDAWKQARNTYEEDPAISAVDSEEEAFDSKNGAEILSGMNDDDAGHLSGTKANQNKAGIHGEPVQDDFAVLTNSAAMKKKKKKQKSEKKQSVGSYEQVPFRHQGGEIINFHINPENHRDIGYKGSTNAIEATKSIEDSESHDGKEGETQDLNLLEVLPTDLKKDEKFVDLESTNSDDEGDGINNNRSNLATNETEQDRPHATQDVTSTDSIMTAFASIGKPHASVATSVEVLD